MYTSYTYTNSPLEKFIGLLTLSRAFANHVCACSGTWRDTSVKWIWQTQVLFSENFIVKTNTQEHNNKLFIITISIPNPIVNIFQAILNTIGIQPWSMWQLCITLFYATKTECRSARDVFIFTYQCCRQIKLYLSWPLWHVDITDQTPIWAVLLCKKEQEQFKSPLGNFHCLIHVPFPGTDYLPWPSY